MTLPEREAMICDYLACFSNLAPLIYFFFFQAEDGIRDLIVTGVQTCALPILNDKFIVREPSAADQIQWNRLNQPLEAAAFERLKAAALTHLSGQELFVRDLFEIGRASCRERV